MPDIETAVSVFETDLEEPVSSEPEIHLYSLTELDRVPVPLARCTDPLLVIVWLSTTTTPRPRSLFSPGDVTIHRLDVGANATNVTTNLLDSNVQVVCASITVLARVVV